MIFTLRLLVFSFFIILGFRISVRSIKGRATTSVIYGCVLLYYTFLCRSHLYVNVSADDYGHALTTQRNVGESIWQLLKSIFGMELFRPFGIGRLTTRNSMAEIEFAKKS